MIRLPLVASLSVLSLGCLSSALVAADSGWVERAPLPSARCDQRAVLLHDGTVLVAGGYGAAGYTVVSDAYDFRKDVWVRHAAMQFPHLVSTCYELVALPQNHALAISPNVEGQSRSEEYDPVTAAWHAIPALPDDRIAFKAVALPNGDVLVAGGIRPSQLNTTIPNSLLYHPGTTTWTSTGNMHQRRDTFTLTVLPTGRVLAAGGHWAVEGGPDNLTAACETYVPELGTWTVAGTLTAARSRHQSALLDNGQVVTVGGVPSNLPTSEKYVPETQSSATTNRATVAYTDAFTTLRGGALRAGGTATPNGSIALAAVDLFSSKTRTWSAGPALPIARRLAPAVTLPSGEVLVIGGAGSIGGDTSPALASVELYSLRPLFPQAEAEAGGTVGRTFSLQLDAATLATYTSVGLPPGIALNKVTGHLGGKPTTPGSYRVRIGATNEFGKSLMYLTLSIAPAQPPSAADALKGDG